MYFLHLLSLRLPLTLRFCFCVYCCFSCTALRCLPPSSQQRPFSKTPDDSSCQLPPAFRSLSLAATPTSPQATKQPRCPWSIMDTSTDAGGHGEVGSRSSIDKPPILAPDPAFDRLPDEIIQQYDCVPAISLNLSSITGLLTLAIGYCSSPTPTPLRLSSSSTRNGDQSPSRPSSMPSTSSNASPTPRAILSFAIPMSKMKIFRA